MKNCLRLVGAFSALLCLFVPLALQAQDQTVSGKLTVTGVAEIHDNVDIYGDILSLGTRTDLSTDPGWLTIYTDGTTSSVEFTATRAANLWKWQQDESNAVKVQMSLSEVNDLVLYDQSSPPVAKITLSPTGTSVFATSVTFEGIDNQMPNQTVVGAGSVLTVELADARYLSSSSSALTLFPNATATGIHSAAFGEYSTASGDNAFAIGANSTASGYASTSLGYSTADGYASVSMGYANANGYASVAMGYSTAEGNSSLAAGNSTTADGDSSVAMGNSTSAIGGSSSAFGNGSSAGGYASAALGNYSEASGDSAFAAGNYATAEGYAATAMGNGTSATEYASTALGNGSFATEYGSTAMGNSVASGYGSTAMGYSTASGSGSTALGSSTATGDNSASMGIQTLAQAYGSVVIGANNVAEGDSANWVPTDPLFVIGNGTGDSNDPPEVQNRNALVVYKNGQINIPKRQGDILMGEFGGPGDDD